MRYLRREYQSIDTTNDDKACPLVRVGDMFHDQNRFHLSIEATILQCCTQVGWVTISAPITHVNDSLATQRKDTPADR